MATAKNVTEPGRPEDERWDEPPLSNSLDVPQLMFLQNAVEGLDYPEAPTYELHELGEHKLLVVTTRHGSRGGLSDPPVGGSEPPPPVDSPSAEVWAEPPARDDLQQPGLQDADRRWWVALAGIGLVFVVLIGGVLALLMGRFSGEQYLQLSLPIATAVIGAVVGYYLRPLT